MKNDKTQQAQKNIYDMLKDVLYQAIMVIAYRDGDVSNENGNYATTDCDSLIRLESALCEYLGTSSDDIDMQEALSRLESMYFPYGVNPAPNMQLILTALSHAETICDRVPPLCHLPNLRAPIELQEIGRLVNFQEDSGHHGYALINDAKQHVKNLIKFYSGAIGHQLQEGHEKPNKTQQKTSEIEELESLKDAYAALFNKRAMRVHDLQGKVREALDKKSCPGIFMQIASDAILEHGCGELADTAYKLQRTESERDDAIRAAAKIANAFQDLYNDCGEDPQIKAAYKKVETLISDYAGLEGLRL